eukprot:CAMPEP_0182585612 /NCGR_PEP_ID=MMETSP1324-20130603/60752_1 /TAXON_ID=236786 /ORGANISM="Florenciella sp., Strain RCC1587" /LENGTH=33 /DNA_ID= /DNA_START= /DNA_END= /DNA_ORIENTATION=
MTTIRKLYFKKKELTRVEDKMISKLKVALCKQD